MKDDLRYTSSDCFETFPFPKGTLTLQPTTDNSQLTTIGDAYFTYRAALMVDNNEGLTKIYNRFHDPDERSPKIIKLRELHAEMDRAVLEAYGWNDLAATAICEFLLDYEDEVDSSLPTTDNRQLTTRKKPWRYRWPDEFRDEVLARLLELNAKRAQEETLSGQKASARKPLKSKRRSVKGSSQDNNPTLPGL